MDIGAWVRNNKGVVAGGGVAAAAGLFVLLRRKQTTGSSSTDTTSGTTGNLSSTTGSAFPDTTGTDLASWLGNQSSMLANQQQDFLNNLSSQIGSLQQVPPGSSGTGTPSPTTTPTPLPAITPAPITTPVPAAVVNSPQYVKVGRYTNSNPVWNSTLSGIASHQGTTVSALMKLNPFITNPNLIRTGASIRVS